MIHRKCSQEPGMIHRKCSQEPRMIHRKCSQGPGTIHRTRRQEPRMIHRTRSLIRYQERGWCAYLVLPRPEILLSLQITVALLT